MQKLWNHSIQLMAAVVVFSVGAQAAASEVDFGVEPGLECKFRLEKERALFEKLRANGELSEKQVEIKTSLIRNAELAELGTCLREGRWFGIRDTDVAEYEIYIEQFYLTRSQQLAAELQNYAVKGYESARVFTERQLRDLGAARMETCSQIQAFRIWWAEQK